MMTLHADLEDGQPAGPLYGEMLAATLAAFRLNRPRIADTTLDCRSLAAAPQRANAPPA